jgi:hypothetical protein
VNGRWGLLVQAINLFATIDEQLHMKPPIIPSMPHMRISMGRALISAGSRFSAA